MISAGTVFVNENDASRVMYVIKSGKARVYKKYQDAKIILAHLGPGDICGELSLFDSRPRSASVEALTDLSVVVLNVAQGETQISSLPDWAQAMLRTLANRIREADQQILGLKSISEYQKKAYRFDSFTRTLYEEARRTFALLKLVYQDFVSRNQSATPQEFRNAFLKLVGPQLVLFDKSWEFMRDYQIIDYPNQETPQSPPIKLNTEVLEAITFRIDLEIQSERYLALGNSARLLLDRITQVGTDTDEEQELTRNQFVSDKTGGSSLPEALYTEGLQELSRCALVNTQKDKHVFSCNVASLKKIAPIQDLLKRLDRSNVKSNED